MLDLPPRFPYLTATMAYWLLKTEPTEYSYTDLEREQKTRWGGVTNNLALLHIRAMARGDIAFIYHSGNEKCIVAVAEIISNPYADPGEDDPKRSVVDVKPKSRLARSIPLAAVKARKEFSDFALVRNSRLSVMPVTETQWKLLLSMSH